MNRRKFLRQGALGSAAACTLPVAGNFTPTSFDRSTITAVPKVIATWNVEAANTAAWNILDEGGTALDAVEQGCRVEEADPGNQTVGFGGRPDRDGEVTLDACIMDHQGRCGSVVYLKNIQHPVSVARRVMEKTPHVMLAGEGAKKFAVQEGFPEKDLLTPASREDWENWKKKSEYKPIINIENHDTIGMLALDKDGHLAGACTTSGMAFKMAGRVGDSPIIGSGLYIDQEVGGATATGMGEVVMRSVGSFLVVELMRQGHSPDTACKMAVQRIVNAHPDHKNFQVGFIALNRKGESGAYCIQPGFSYRENASGIKRLNPADSLLSKK